MSTAGEGGWPKRRRVVLFCDISGFMRLSVRLGGRMADFVQAYYEMAGEAGVSGGGRLVKYIGDAILCVFSEGCELEAVRCAVRMRTGFTELLGLHAPGDAARLGVAISSGEVAEGIFGHGSLRMFDVMGEAVAHAAVLNRIPGIIVSSEVRDAVGAMHGAEELPAIPLKWRADALEAWRVREE